MVRTLIGTIAGLVAAASWTQAGVHLTPTLAEYQLDGMKFTRLVFPDDSGKPVTYSPPAKWHYAGSGTRLTLQPPGKTQAEASVTVVPLSTPDALDEESVNKLTEEARAAVPKDSSDIVVVAAEKNPVFIGQKETLLVTISYTCYGERFGRSLMFLNRDKEQIRFQLVAHLDDFKDLQAAFLQSHFTWQNL